MKYVLIMIAAITMAGCGINPEGERVQPEEGDIRPICTAWTNSSSAFERKFSTNLFVRFEDGAWRTRIKEDDGSFSVFWKTDTAYDSPEKAERTFSVNTQWTVNKAIHDAFSELNK